MAEDQHGGSPAGAPAGYADAFGHILKRLQAAAGSPGNDLEGHIARLKLFRGIVDESIQSLEKIKEVVGGKVPVPMVPAFQEDPYVDED